MRIGMDARLWDQTGVGRYIRSLVLNLQKIDKKNEYIIFVLPKDENEIKNQMVNDKWSMVNVDIRWHSFSEQIEFSRILNSYNLDLVHFPYFSVPLLYNKPFVVTIHDLIVHHFPTGQASTLSLPLYELKRLAYKFVIKSAAKRANKIITVSNSTKDEIVDHLGINKDKVVVIYNGVDSQLLNLKHKTINLKTKYFLYVGNAYPHKNLERLLLAFQQLSFNYKDVNLVLAGRQDYFYNRLETRIKELGLSERVNMEKHLDDKGLQDLYANALALVQPSLMEGFGLPAVEAMASGCLVLASDIPSLREICGDAALYFDPYSTESLKKIMFEVYFDDSNHRSKNKEKGYELAKKFSWEKAAEETLKVYESCAGL